jgi:hypothetical protein
MKFDGLTSVEREELAVLRRENRVALPVETLTTAASTAVPDRDDISAALATNGPGLTVRWRSLLPCVRRFKT